MHIIATDDNVVLGLLYQDQEMKSLFQAFPEVLFVDATYCMNNRQMALYLLVVEDGNGESEVVGVWLLRDETTDTIRSAVSTFCSDNPRYHNVQCIMADKDFVEREAFAASFPDAKIHVCLFHTLRTFRREVTTDKMSISPAQRDRCLEMLQQLAYASSEENYMKLYNDFVQAAPMSVRQYFDRNWHDIRDQWVRGLMCETMNFGNTTNNRLESLNQKVKSVVAPNCTFASCVSSLKSAIESLRAERDHRAVAMVQKRSVCFYAPDDPCKDYAQLLTPFAMSMVTKQLSKSRRIQDADIVADDDESWSVRSSSGTYTATADTCRCAFFTSMRLPCQHIFAVRKSATMSLYAQSLCAVRWTRQYYQRFQRVFVQAAPSLPSLKHHNVPWPLRVKIVVKHSWYVKFFM